MLLLAVTTGSAIQPITVLVVRVHRADERGDRRRRRLGVARACWSGVRRRRAGGLVSAFDPAPLGGGAVRRSRASGSASSSFGIAVVIVVAGSGLPDVRPPGPPGATATRRMAVAAARGDGPGARPPRPDVRPQGPAAGRERAHVRGATCEPADLPFTQRDRGGRPTRGPAEDQEGRDSIAELDKAAGDRFQLIRLAENVPTTRRPRHRRGAPDAARRDRGRRIAPPLPVRPAREPHARLDRARSPGEDYRAPPRRRLPGR